MTYATIRLLQQRLLRSGLALTVVMVATFATIMPTFAVTYDTVAWAVTLLK